MYLYLYLFVYIYINMYIHTYIRIFIYMYKYIYAYCVRASAFAHVFCDGICTCTHISANEPHISVNDPHYAPRWGGMTCMQVYIYVYMVLLYVIVYFPPQKSPVSPQKSPISVWKSPFMRLDEEWWRVCKCMIVRAYGISICTCICISGKKPISPQKSPRSPQKSRMSQKNSIMRLDEMWWRVCKRLCACLWRWYVHMHKCTFHPQVRWNVITRMCNIHAWHTLFSLCIYPHTHPPYLLHPHPLSAVFLTPSGNLYVGLINMRDMTYSHNGYHSLHIKCFECMPNVCASQMFLSYCIYSCSKARSRHRDTHSHVWQDPSIWCVRLCPQRVRQV